MNTCTQVPPGFRFHPTDEELVDYYLRRKVNSKKIDIDIIKEVDLYKIEPWDLQEICKMRKDEKSEEWYFFSHKDKKYPTGTRTNRATTAGFWKATGRDKAIYSKRNLIGMRKTLVFYKGRAPNGHKSDWIMHEYRLETTHDNRSPDPQEEGWVVCRVFKKRSTSMRNSIAHESKSPSWYDEQVLIVPNESNLQNQASYQSNNLVINTYANHHHNHGHHLPFHNFQEHDHLMMPLPILDNSKLILSSPLGLSNCLYDNSLTPHDVYDVNIIQGNASMLSFHDKNNNNGALVLTKNNICDDDQGSIDHQVIDWRALDKFVASQLDQEDVGNKEYYNNSLPSTIVSTTFPMPSPMSTQPNQEESSTDNASSSTTSSHIDASK